MAALAEKSSAVEDKRRQLLDAAVRVFARKGFHASRVGDIAEEAGVAHGLLYHYFKSKDEVLQAVFHENWSLLSRGSRASRRPTSRRPTSSATSRRSFCAPGSICRTSSAS